MREIFEFRINYDFASRLFKESEGKDLGQLTKSVKVIQITRDDSRFSKIPIIDKEINEKFNRAFYYGWNIYRKYTTKELQEAYLLRVKIKTTFEPAGEECGTVYDESKACEICGTNRKQIGPLKLKKGSIPKKDITGTIAGEVVVSEKFKDAFERYNLQGLTFEKVLLGESISNMYQPTTNSPELALTERTVAGINPFDLSGSEGVEIYKCPKGHTLGLNLLSEAYVEKSSAISEYDFFATKQKIGVKRGLLRPQPLYLCSQAFRKMIEKEKLSGFEFEIAQLDDIIRATK